MQKQLELGFHFSKANPILDLIFPLWIIELGFLHLLRRSMNPKTYEAIHDMFYVHDLRR